MKGGRDLLRKNEKKKLNGLGMIDNYNNYFVGSAKVLYLKEGKD